MIWRIVKTVIFAAASIGWAYDWYIGATTQLGMTVMAVLCATEQITEIWIDD